MIKDKLVIWKFKHGSDDALCGKLFPGHEFNGFSAVVLKNYRTYRSLARLSLAKLHYPRDKKLIRELEPGEVSDSPALKLFFQPGLFFFQHQKWA